MPTCCENLISAVGMHCGRKDRLFTTPYYAKCLGSKKYVHNDVYISVHLLAVRERRLCAHVLERLQ